MAVDRTGDDRPAPERPKRSGGRPGRGFLASRGMAACSQGKKTSRPLRMPIEPSTARRSLVRHAPSRPQWTCQLADQGYTLASSGGDQWNGCIAPTSPKHLVEANDWIWEVPGNAALLLSAGGCGAMPGRVTRLRRAHSPLPASDRPHPGPIQGFKPLEVFRRATGSFKPPTARSRRATWPQIDFTNFSSGLV